MEYGVFEGDGGVFVDLGSGTGKGIIAGILMHPFSKVVGVEMLETLFEKSIEVRDHFL